MATKATKFFRKAGSFLLNVVERDIPTLTFSALFVVFMVQVVCRYLFVPLTWPLEFTLIAFIWTTALGACFAQRDYSHVTFTLIYERTKPKGRLVMRILGNILMVSSFSIALYPSYKYVNFMSFKRSDVLKIPMNIAFSPFIVFLVIMIARFGYNLVVDIHKLVRGET
ncbi:MAG: TRAP transporter small permease [Spirochaetaceae bacterium]|nr:MAG: TRAP transporter small permease [Spirochaetaceae bacterium]